MTAAFMASKDMVNLLLAGGCNPFMIQENGGTLLSALTANEDCDIELLESLCRRYPSLINRKRRPTSMKWNAIEWILKCMYRMGIRSPAVNLFAHEAGDVPLSHAIRRGDVRAVQILLEAGADPNIRTDSNMSAIDICDHYGPFSEIRRMVEEESTTTR